MDLRYLIYVLLFLIKEGYIFRVLKVAKMGITSVMDVPEKCRDTVRSLVARILRLHVSYIHKQCTSNLYNHGSHASIMFEAW